VKQAKLKIYRPVEESNSWDRRSRNAQPHERDIPNRTMVTHNRACLRQHDLNDRGADHLRAGSATVGAHITINASSL